MITVLILLLVGMVLLFLETILPGLVAGIVGLGCLVAGVVISYRDLGTETGHLVLLAVVVALIAGVMLWLRYFPHSRFGRIFVSESTVGNLDLHLEDLVGKDGVAHTVLRPSGTAIIDGKRCDVVSEGAFIDPKTPIRVVAVHGSRVVVRAMP